jgi:hypothetical protein
MDGFKAYKYYMAIKLHFTSEKYDVFETRGHVKGSRDAFTSRNDRYIFEKLAQKHASDKDIIQFFVSNFAYGNDTAIYSNGEAEELYAVWQKRRQSISKVFIDDLANIINYVEIRKLDSNHIFTGSNGDLPILLDLYLGGKVTVETMKIIDDFHPFLDVWGNNSTIRIVLGNGLLRMKKLHKFVKYDADKLSKVFNHFKEELAF